MAISDAVQTLSAAFSFGILLQAAAGALLIYSKGHGASILKDGRRLVLSSFLLFALLWAQMGFLNLLITSQHSDICQATLIISTVFDQLARIGIEQFLLWSVGQGTKANSAQIVLQAILGIRFIAGGILVATVRPDFAPVCIGRTSMEPVAIVVITLDVFIIGYLLVRSVSLGTFRDMCDSRSVSQGHSKGVILVILGLIIWTATSVPMMLGISTIILIARTVVPANGLLVLIGLLTISPGSSLETRKEITTPEAHSPFVVPTQTAREISEEVLGNGTPLAGPYYTGGGNLFVVNPSFTPRDSPGTSQGYFQGAPQGISKHGEEITVRDLDSGQPVPTNLPGYRGSSGVLPTILALSGDYNNNTAAPHFRVNIMNSTQNVPLPSVPRPTVQQTKSLFNRSKQSERPNVRALGISKPIAIEDIRSTEQPFARMQTIDLAQAAINDRERRAAAAERLRLVANRPPPPPPQHLSRPALTGLRNGSILKRKDAPSRVQGMMPAVAASSPSGLYVDAVNGSTTSASLSPGREDVRRRSPRNANAFHPFTAEKAKFLPTLERKQTLGLPSNPRARMAPSRPMSTQTVMLINDIVYDNPGIVKSIIKEAPGMYAASQEGKTLGQTPPNPYITGLKSSDSIIHRPRPYRRDSEKDRALFPTEPSPRHRRSKSGSSILTRKSIFMSFPGSPTTLPPLPPPPTSASKLQRILPYDTKGMSAAEEIQLLFPAPPGTTFKHHRRSSVPSLPQVSSNFMTATPLVQSVNHQEKADRRASKRTTIASFELPTAPLSNQHTTTINERQTFRFSANTYLTLADQVDEEVTVGYLGDADSQTPQNIWTSHTSSTTINDDSTSYWGSIHSEIPPLDLRKAMRNASSTIIQRSQAPAPENSLQPASDQLEELQQGEETMTVMLDREDGRPSIVSSYEDMRDSFLGPKLDPTADVNSSPMEGRTWHRRIGDELPTFSERKAKTRSRKMPPPTPLLLNQRRRPAAVVLRAEPSPPLMDSPQRAIAEIQAQLKRFEEPGRSSVGSILRHLPDPRSSYRGDGNIDESQNDRSRLLENLENEMGQQQNQWQQMHTNLDRDSMSTIATPHAKVQYELEISREASERSSRPPSRALSRQSHNRNDVTVQCKGNDSTTTVSTQSSENSRASLWQQRLAEAQMEYMENALTSQRKQSINFLSVSRSHQLGSPTPPDSVDSGSDMATDFDVVFESEDESVIGIQRETWLWETPLLLPLPIVATGLLWNTPCEKAQRADSPEPPAKILRPALRKIEHVLHISSSDLWVKPASIAISWPVVGLWGSRLVQPASNLTRPLTQRPARKSKRVTFLPDIIESPLPLPNKRDTLGIFQFPWGEASDSAVYEPRFNPALLTRPILSPKLDERSRQLEFEAEYSSSFFDDYDDVVDEDEQSDDDFDETTLWEIASLLNSRDVPSQNSLLPRPREFHEENEEEEEEETDFEEDSETEEAYQKGRIERLSAEIPITPLVVSVKRDASFESYETEVQSKLWSASFSNTLKETAKGLSQPELATWKAYLSSSDNFRRSKPRPFEALPLLASKTLWSMSDSEFQLKQAQRSIPQLWSARSSLLSSTASTPKAPSELLWMIEPVKQIDSTAASLFSLSELRSTFRTTQADPAAISMFRAPRTSTESLAILTTRSLWLPSEAAPQPIVWISHTIMPKQAAPSSALWTSTPIVADLAVDGLFSTAHCRSEYRVTSNEPAASENFIRRARNSEAPLPSLTSHQLWRASTSLPYEHHWITESSIRPSSPSVYSESSSSPSSPASERSSISGSSLKSTSTEASSLSGSVNSTMIPSFWKKIGSNKAAPPQVSENKPASKLPVLASVKDSRGFATRDMWEAKATLPLVDTPKRSFRKATVKKNVNIGKDNFLISPEPLPKKDESRLQRMITTPEMWQAALNEAIARGIRPTARQTQQYNPAVLHPVFFTCALLSSIEDIHPASIGHIVRPAAPALWNLPTSYTALIDAPIRPMWLKGKVAAAQFEHESTKTKRSSPAPRSVDLPVLKSANLWQAPRLEDAPARHWITVTKSAPSQLWSASKTPVEEGWTGMWTIATKTQPAERQNLLKTLHAEPRNRQKRSDFGVEMRELESKHLWSCKSVMPTSPKGWLKTAQSRES